MGRSLCVGGTDCERPSGSRSVNLSVTEGLSAEWRDNHIQEIDQ